MQQKLLDVSKGIGLGVGVDVGWFLTHFITLGALVEWSLGHWLEGLVIMLPALPIVLFPLLMIWVTRVDDAVVRRRRMRDLTLIALLVGGGPFILLILGSFFSMLVEATL